MTWNHAGRQRPDFAIEPGPGQESVWDYPRPPASKRDHRLVEVKDGAAVIARTRSSYRVLETASPPSFYIPPGDVDFDQLVKTAVSSVCEWKGAAQYWALGSRPDKPIAWRYPRPRARFELIRDFMAFYPGRIACYVDNEGVEPQPGPFYGGGITADVVGPFKGDPGTGHW